MYKYLIKDRDDHYYSYHITDDTYKFVSSQQGAKRFDVMQDAKDMIEELYFPEQCYVVRIKDPKFEAVEV